MSRRTAPASPLEPCWCRARILLPAHPDHNMAPTKQAPVVLTRHALGGSDVSADPTRQLRLLTWGLVPSWSRTPPVLRG